MSKSIYHVRTDGQPETFCVSNSHERGVKAPRTEGSLRYIPGTGLELTMKCWEKNPKAVKKIPDERICEDSCMEMFLCCFPQLPGAGYLNVEMNALGIAKCAFGPDRHNRQTLLEMGLSQPAITATKGEGYWQVQCTVTEQLLEKLYKQPCHFAPGHIMGGNFYKCGDETEAPHWATWSELERLDFHTPEFFGVLEIV